MIQGRDIVALQWKINRLMWPIEWHNTTDLEGHFCCLKHANSDTSGNIAVTMIRLQCTWLVIATVLSKLKVTGSHVPCKSGNVLEMVHDKGINTPERPLIGSNSDDLE